MKKKDLSYCPRQEDSGVCGNLVDFCMNYNLYNKKVVYLKHQLRLSAQKSSSNTEQKVYEALDQGYKNKKLSLQNQYRVPPFTPAHAESFGLIRRNGH